MNKVNRKNKIKNTLAPRTRMILAYRIVVVSVLAGVLLFTGSIIYLNFGNSEKAFAATAVSWNGSVDNNWNNASNWSPAVIPGPGSLVTIGMSPRDPQLSDHVTVTDLILNNGAKLRLNDYSITLNGNYIMNNGSELQMSKSTAVVLGNATINGGVISASGGLNPLTQTPATFIAKGTNTVIGSTGVSPMIQADLVVTSATVTLRSTTFNGTVSIEKSGITNDACFGGNVFNRTASFTNSGSGSFILSNNSRDIYNEDVVFNNSGSNLIHVAYSDASGTQFNGNVIVNSTSGTGVQFCMNTGRASVAAGKKLTSGSAGFNTGTLNLRKLTFNDTSSITIDAGPSGRVTLGPSTSFAGDVTINAGLVLLNGCTFNGKTNITKTGGTNDLGTGGNIFNGDAVITNSGSGYLGMGNGSPDVFNGRAVFINNGTNNFHLAYSSAGNQFNGPVHIHNSGSGTTSNFLFNDGPLNTATVLFNSDVTINNNATATNALVRLANRGTTTFNGNIEVNSTSGLVNTQGIHFGNAANNSTSNLASNKSLTIGPAGFSRGSLVLNRFIQNSPGAIELMTGNQAGIIIGSGTVINARFSSSSGALVLNGGTFNATAEMEKTGSTNDVGAGGNIFNSNVTITNRGSGYLMTANAAPDIFQSDANIQNLGSSHIYLAHNVAGSVFNGRTILNNNGSGADARIYVCENSANATAVFNSQVQINNSGTSATSLVRISCRGNTTFNDDVEINSNGGGNGTVGIYFGWPGFNGATTLASGKRIFVGTQGFDKGTLLFRNFTQSGSSPMSFNLTGNAVMHYGGGNLFNGDISSSSPGLLIDGTRFNAGLTAEKSGAGNNVSAGGNYFNGTCRIVNSGSGMFYMANASPDTFMTTSEFINSGTSYTYIAHNVAGNLFNGDVSITNSGSGTDSRLLIGEGSVNASSVFNGNLIVNNSASSSTAMIRFNLRGNHTYNGNITLNSTVLAGNPNNGIFFGWATFTGTGIQSAGKTFAIGSEGYNTGALGLINFTKQSTSPMNLTLGNTGSLTIGPAAVINGNVTASSGTVLLNGCTFNGTVNIAKTGNTGDVCAGGNVFNQQAEISHSGSGNFIMARTNPDRFNASSVFNNTGTGFFYLAEQAAGNEFNGPVTLNNTGSGGNLRMLICETSATSSAVFNGDVTVNNTGTASDGMVRFSLNGSCTFNGNIVLNSSIGSTSTNGVCFGWGGFNGTCTQAASKTISIGSAGWTGGALLFEKFTQLGNAPINLNLTGTSKLIFGRLSIFNGDIVSASPGLSFNGSTFNGSVNCRKTGSSSDNSFGSNTFNSAVTITSAGTGNMILANNARDVFEQDATFNQEGSGILYVAHNDGNGSDFNGNIFVNCSGTGSIRFSQGTGKTSLSSGKRIGIGNSGFSSGDLYLRNFTQNGMSLQSILAPSGNSRIYLQTGTVFNGPLTLSFPQVFLNGANFNGTTDIEKNGATDNASSGGNIFNGITSIRNRGSGYFLLSNISPDNFNGPVSFTQNGTGIMYPAYNQINVFSGNISTIGTNSVISFGAGTGTVVMNGNSEQKIFGDAAFAPRIRRLTMNNSGSGLSLEVPVTVYTSLNMTSGNINSTSTNLLIIDNGISTVSGVSNASFVNGPVRKIGNQAFTFPVGRNGLYRPISMTAPSSAADHFTAEYIRSFPIVPSNATLDLLLSRVSTCEYWNLNRTNGASTVFVTLSWNSSTCAVSNINDLRVSHYNAGLNQWIDYGLGSVTGVNASGNIVSAIRPVTYGLFTLGSSTAVNALPVEMAYFKAAFNNGSVLAEWKTMSEINNDYFNIERSRDGINFEFVGKVKGSGNTTNSQEYSFRDERPYSGISYYRIKQTDFDGKFEYYGPVKVSDKNSMKEFSLESISPNPFNDKISIEFFNPESSSMEFQIISLSGALLSSRIVSAETGNQNIMIDQLGDIPSGVCFLRIISDGKILNTQKIIRK
ncbi:MAG: T9SS C-terminal target domain-containing protein [Bacteroidetes bacterium]|nr:MAG: T9SS C-terminal target domain-containing protein [Bacteroidota bacterium]REK05783.1 MAG: T9SS C-terminal target domain-containing protein [Bacteroidota bacterium]REK31912.1 MAG: T9SS C-terminal target domain-containing protein [Bacteroidota bacterium]REK49977.1 MAG: T9SS C-terminal target domain-containing protein [Bacteroidota bacterium]